MTEDGAGHFTLTSLGEALKTGAPGAARSAILTLASPWITSGWEHLLESVQTGRPGLEQALGMPIFDWLAKHPEEASLFSETMVSFHGAEPAAVAAAYDFSRLTTIVNVGGATGNLLAAILDKYPESRGILSTSTRRARCPQTELRAAWLIASRLCPAVSLSECLKEEMRTCSRTSSTIGRRSSA